MTSRPYKPEFTVTAAAQIQALVPRLRRAVREHVLIVCKSPTQTSRPSVSPPYLPGYQMHEFRDSSGQHLFCLLFKYGMDEETLIFHGVGHADYGEQRLPDSAPF
jgi:hypothetical protein